MKLVKTAFIKWKERLKNGVEKDVSRREQNPYEKSEANHYKIEGKQVGEQ